MPLPWFVVNGMIKATEMAEEILGHPPQAYEILLVCNDYFTLPVSLPGEIAAILTCMVREDWIMIDKKSYRYTVRQ